MPSYRAVLFDFFGTLTEAICRGPEHTTVARRLGCDPTAFTDVLDRSFLARACGAYGDAAQSMLRVARCLHVRPTSTDVTAALSARLRAVRADTRLRPDAVPVLTDLRCRGIRTAVVSDCTHELPELLPTLPVAPLLDAFVYSIDVGACKPAREMYLTACRRLGVQPEECLYVGDGGNHELSGADALGMTAVRLAAPDLAAHLRFNAEAEWSGPTAGSLREAVALLDQELVGQR